LSSDDKDDLTRLEDLSEFFHNEEEEFKSLDDMAKDLPDSPPDFSDEKTDPNLEVPTEEQEEDFTTSSNDESNFEFSEEDAPDFDTGFSEEDSPDFDNNFSDEDTPDFENNFTEEDTPDFESEFDSENSTEQEDFPVFQTTEGEEEHGNFSTDANGQGPDNDDFDIQTDEDSDFVDQVSDPQSIENVETENIISDEVPVSTSEQQIEKDELIQVPIEEKENFSDLAASERNLMQGSHAQEGNPPFSIIIENIKYKEDAEKIYATLINYQIIESTEKEEIFQSLERGVYLIPRISEYTAILISHSLRDLNINLKVDHTQKISNPTSYNTDDRGLLSRRSLLNNKKQFFQFNDHLRIDDIITTNLSSLPQYDVLQYQGLVSCLQVVNENQLIIDHKFEEKLQTDTKKGDYDKVNYQRITLSNEQAQKSISHDKINFNVNYYQYKKDIQHTFNELTLELKYKAIENKANAVLGIQFQITPIGKNILDSLNYQITATGNLAWIQKK